MSVLLLEAIRDREPFVYAKQKFYAGELLVEQAILMVSSDSEFRYNAILSGKWHDSRAAAEDVVRRVWCRELCERIAKAKRLSLEDDSRLVNLDLGEQERS